MSSTTPYWYTYTTTGVEPPAEWVTVRYETTTDDYIIENNPLFVASSGSASLDDFKKKIQSEWDEDENKKEI